VIRNLKSGTILHRLPAHGAENIEALAFVPGGEFLLSGSYDKTLKLWNLRNAQMVEEFHFDQPVHAVACASNGMVCVGLEGGQVCFLRLNNLPRHSRQLEECGSR
jgi:WD40 repeat protein